LAKRKRRTTAQSAERRFRSLLRQGTQALHNGEIRRSVQLLERAHKINAEHPDVALNLAGAYILSKKFKEAVALLEPLSQVEPDNPMVWTNLGAAYLGNPILAKDDNQQRAIDAFKKALELHPTAPNVAYNLGLVYRDRKEFDEAIHWFRQALEANPKDKDAQYYIDKLSQANENETEETT